MAVNLYFLHKIISKLGNKITSFAIVFMLMKNFPKSALLITIFLFSIDSITNILFTKVYLKITNKAKNIKWLVLLDVLSAVCVIGIFMSFNNIYILLAIYIIATILNDLTDRFDRGLFYTLTKNTDKETKHYQMSGSIDTILSMIAPVITAEIIFLMGNKSSLLVDSFSFLLGALIYYFVIQKININKFIKEEEVEERKISRDSSLFSQFKQYFKTLSFDFSKLLLVYMVVALITNLEEPLIFNYLTIERGFSEQLIGISFMLFSLGMFIGSRAYDLIEDKKISILFIVGVDAICSFLLSLPILNYLIIFFYTIQGIFAMILIISFQVSLQKEFDVYEEFLDFRNIFIFIMSFITLFSYGMGMALSLAIPKSSLIFKMMAVAELTSSAIIIYTITKKERRGSNESKFRKNF